MTAVAKVSQFNLASGHRLTRAEFERRYEASPKNLKCELIEAPARQRPADRGYRDVLAAGLINP